MKRIIAAVVTLLVAAPVFAAMPNPIVHWSGQFTDDGKVADLSGNNVTMNKGEGVTVVDDAEMGKVLAFDGTRAGWAQTSERFPHINARTISMWIRREATIPLSDNAYPHLIGALCGLNCAWYQTTDLVRFCLANPTAKSDDNIYTKIEMTFPAEEWHFMVWTLNPTGTANQYEVAGYLDGLQVGTTQTLTFTKSIDYSDPDTKTDYMVLGNNAQNNNRGFYGQVRDVRIYDVALTKNQQTKLWLDDKALLSKKLVGYWPLEEITGKAGSARSTPDLSGNGYDLTCGGSDIDVVPGIKGNCFSFTAPLVGNGNTGYGIMTFKIDKPIGPYTVSMWLKRDQFTAVKNGPRVFVDYTDPVLQMQVGALTEKYLTVSYNSKNHATTADAIKRAGEWSFATVVFDTAYDADSDTYSGKHTFYMNGELVPSAPDEVFSKARYPLAKNSRFIFCSNAFAPNQGTRNFPGCLDDIRMIDGALTADEVKALYRGAAKVDAGADFAVVGEKAVLKGAVADSSADFGIANGYAGTVSWELVSAPAGGEDAAIQQPGSAVTEVTLPVVGAYTFRLKTAVGTWAVTSDDVVVTRVASASQGKPTVTGASANPATVEKSGVAVLSATVSNGARVRWSVVSGPGAVWFKPENAAKTSASFSATGSYVLRCTAETDAGSATADVTVTVNAAFADDITDGLLAKWTFESEIKESVSATVGSVVGDSSSTFRYVPGSTGYTAGNYDARNDYINTLCRMPDGTDTYVAHAEPSAAERYRTMSAWIYIDSADTNATRTAYIFYQAYNLILAYRTDKYLTEADRGTFWVGQATAKNDEQGLSQGAFYTMAFNKPSKDIKDRWVHVVLVLDRKNYNKTAGAGAKLYVDGEQLTYKAESGMTGYTANGRMLDYKLLLGGCPNAVPGKNDGWETEEISRRFPGIVDELRIYGRELTVGEIAYLAANPSRGNMAPCVIVESVPSVFLRKTPSVVKMTAADDGKVKPMTCKWEVVSGDPSQVVFADATSAETQVTINQAGNYSLVLKAFDGERTTWSDPVEVRVVPRGMMVVFW